VFILLDLIILNCSHKIVSKNKMVTTTATPAISTVNPRDKALDDFRKKIMEHKEIEARLKQSRTKFKLNIDEQRYILCIFILVREDLRSLTKEYDKSENDLKALQSVGQV
jgi:26S proteasome regulatory subunit T4